MENTKNSKDIIDEFLDQVDLIFNSAYLRNHRETNITINWENDKGTTFTGSPLPSRENVEAFLMRVRPVIAKEERLYVGKIIRYLIQKSKSDLERKDLKKLELTIELHRNRRLFSIRIDDKEYGMPEFAWLYMYGKYFHVDKDKKKVIEKFENFLGPLPEVSALSQIEAYASFAFLLAGYIKRSRAMK